MNQAMIWCYHNASGLLLVQVTLLRFSLLLPFFRHFSHPQRIRFSAVEVGLSPASRPSTLFNPPFATHSADTLQPPELWGSIHEEACKGSADATRLSTSFEHGLPRLSTSWTIHGLIAARRLTLRFDPPSLTVHQFTFPCVFTTDLCSLVFLPIHSYISSSTYLCLYMYMYIDKNWKQSEATDSMEFLFHSSNILLSAKFRSIIEIFGNSVFCKFFDFYVSWTLEESER